MPIEADPKDRDSLSAIVTKPVSAEELDANLNVSTSDVRETVKHKVAEANKQQLSLDDVPQGQEGIDWLLAHREEVFPSVVDQLQLDNGGAPSPSRFAVGALTDHANLMLQQGYRHWPKTKEQMARARKEIAQSLGASPDEIAFKQNTTDGIKTITERFNWKEGDKVVVLRKDKEFPTNFYPWKDLERIGVQIVEIGDENGFISIEEIQRALDQNPRMIALSSCGWNTGQRVDLEKIGDLIHQHNINNQGAKTRFCVDAIQTLGVQPIDAKKANIDFLAAGGSKWILAGSGKGIFYCSKDAMKEMRTTGLGANSREIAWDPNSPIKIDASVFEDGTQNYEGICALGEAFALINKIGLDNINNRVLELSDYLAQKLTEQGFEVRSPRSNPAEKSSIVLFRHPKFSTVDELATFNGKLQSQDKPIWMSLRNGALRACVHYYNTKEEIDELLQALSAGIS